LDPDDLIEAVLEAHATGRAVVLRLKGDTAFLTGRLENLTRGRFELVNGPHRLSIPTAAIEDFALTPAPEPESQVELDELTDWLERLKGLAAEAEKATVAEQLLSDAWRSKL